MNFEFEYRLCIVTVKIARVQVHSFASPLSTKEAVSSFSTTTVSQVNNPFFFLVFLLFLFKSETDPGRLYLFWKVVRMDEKAGWLARSRYSNLT